MVLIISIQDVWSTAAADHARFLEGVIDKGLGKLSNTFIEREVSKFVLGNKRCIVYGKSADLAQCIERFSEAFPGELIRECANDVMGKVFDYESFSAKSRKPWTAYHLCLQARYKVCCYCHLVDTGTCLPDEETKGYRPPIDHYYGKAEYPFLSLSLFNFIPCCEKCNGRQMKGDVDFYQKPHLNPLVDEESIEFFLTPALEVVDKLAEFASFALPRECYKLDLHSVRNHKKSIATINTFQLKRRYGTYSNQAYYLAKKLRGSVARLQFHQSELDFRTEVEDYLEFEPDEYKSVPYGKVRMCMAKQFGVEL